MIDQTRPFDRHVLRLRRDRLARFAAGEADFAREVQIERLIERIGEMREPPRDVLEIGAGRGELAAALARSGLPLPARHVALELSAAQSRLNPQRLRLVADEEFLPIREESVDLVVSAMAFHLVNDLPGVLVQIRKALRAGGVLIAIFPGGATLQELREVMSLAEIEVRGGFGLRAMPMIDVRDAGALLQRCGFAMPVADQERIDVRYRDPMRLLSDLRLSAQSNIMAERERSPLRAAILARALELYRERHAAPGDGEGVIATLDLVTMTGVRAG